MNSKIKILIGLLITGVVLIGGWFILNWKYEKLGEIPGGSGIDSGFHFLIKSDKEVYTVGEEIKVTITLKNNLAERIVILTPGMQNDYKKAYYFQLIDSEGNLIEEENREVLMSHTETIGAEKVILEPDQEHTFYAYLNGRGYGIEYKHYFNTLVKEGIYQLRGVYKPEGASLDWHLKDVWVPKGGFLASKTITIKVVEKKEELALITNKIEYERGENVTIMAKNFLDQSIDLFSVGILKFGENNREWMVVNNNIECSKNNKCNIDCISITSWIDTNQTLDFMWDQTICGNTPKVGRFKARAKYDFANKDELMIKESYSNEFTIK